MWNGECRIRNAECARPRAPLYRAVTLLLPLILLFGLLRTLHAQASVGSYTVQSGDTLFVIAQQFGVSVAELVTLNQLTDANVLQVGQVLLIPATTGAGAVLANIPTVAVPAKPGETLLRLARRYSQEVSLLAALNQMTSTTQLFPGQPVRLPLNQPLPIPLRFGAVRRVAAPDELAQGHTGRLLIETSRAVSLSVAWNALPIPLVPLDSTGKQSFALLPTSALAEVGAQSLVITYTAANGRLLVHTQPITVVDGGYASQTIELPPDRTALLDPTLLTSETQKVAVIWAQVSPQRWSNMPRPAPLARGGSTMMVCSMAITPGRILVQRQVLR
jgi:LysM repeat protein